MSTVTASTRQSLAECGVTTPLAGGPLLVHSPIDGSPLAALAETAANEVDEAVAAAHAAFLAWRTVPPPRRGELLRLFAAALRRHKAALAELVVVESGKIRSEALGEVQEMIDICDFALGLSRQLHGLTIASERPGHRLMETWHPLGVCGVVTAFNFPVAVWAWNSFIAAICGDISIWKPSPKTPLTAIASMKICNEALRKAGFPDLFFLFNDAGTQIAQKFVDDHRVPLISFTGSTQVGRLVGERVAQRMGRSLLELGGNNAIIVDETADLKLAIPAIVFGAVGTAGQRCTTTRRVFVQESIYADVLAKLKSAYAQVEKRLGDPTDAATLLGPLNSEASVSAFLKAVARAKELGGTIECGGTRVDRPGNFVLPTIVTGLKNSDDIIQAETFAPILYVMPFKTLPEAIALQNGVPQGLSSSIFTQNVKAAEAFLSAAGSDCGIANVNIGTSGAEIGGAFGGEKETGGGRESGSTAWQAYMRRQTNTINYSDALPLAQGIKFDF